MWKRTVALLIVLAMALSSFGGPWAGVEEPSEIGRTNTIAPAIEPMPEVEQLLADISEHFVENLGQIENAAVRYYAHGDELSVGFMDSGVMYTLRGQDPGSLSGIDPVALMCWYEGANDVEPRGVSPQGSSSNFFRGSDPSRWVRHAPSFSEVRYDDLYDGVDLRFYFMDGKLKYDLILEACADPDRIVFRYDGADGLGIDPTTGDLLIHTSAGLLRDTRPVVFQGIEDGSNGIGAAFEIISDTSCRFMIPSTVDPNMPMVIDPGLEFSTFFGGDDYDYIDYVKVDGAGNLYLIGRTYSSDFPTTPGAYCTELNNLWDLSVTKFDPAAGTPTYSTYIGGAGEDDPYGSILTSEGVLYIVGATMSDDFPLTDDAIRMNYSGREGFLLKLSADGSSLLYSTYIGGYGRDTVKLLEMDDTGSIYLGGETNSSDLPVSQGAFCTTHQSQTNDYQLFLMKLDSAMRQVLYCTYIGGDHYDILNDMILDDDDNLLLIGTTRSMDFPTTPGAFDEVKNDTSQDIAVLKLNAQGTSLLYSTFIGGNDIEVFYTMKVLDDGSLYIAGLTNSTDFPITQGAFDTSKDTNYSDAFLLRLNNDGSDIVYSTYLGGNGVESISSIRLAKDGRLNLFGRTNSTDFPTTPDAICATRSGAFDEKDVFFAIMDGRLTSLEFSTFFGGTGPVGNIMIEWTSEDFFYLSGMTESTELSTTLGCFDAVHRGNWDLFIVGVNLTKKSLEYCSYLGGGDKDWPVFITTDSQGHLIVVGGTDSSDFPVTNGTFQSTHGGIRDWFVARIDPVPCDPPYRPLNLTATALEDVVWLDWDPPVFMNTRVLSHKIYRGTSADNVTYYDEIGYFDRYNATYSDANTINGTKYYYKLSAVNSRGEGGLTIIPVVAMPYGPPTPPLDFTARTGNGKVTLTWEPPEMTGGFPLMGYRIFRGTTRQTIKIIETVGPDVTTWEDDSVDIGKFYYYSMEVFTNLYSSVRTDAIRIKPVDVPSSPTQFKVEAGDGHVKLSWGLPSADGGVMLVGFHVWRAVEGGAMEVIATFDYGTLAFKDTDVTNGHAYVYYVTAFSNVGESPPTTPLDAIPFGLPGEPLDPQAEAEDGKVTLTWGAPLSDGGSPITRYIIYWGTASGNLENVQTIGNVVTFVHIERTNGVTYYYQVLARTGAGDGPVSIVVHATPMGLPGVPTGFTATSVTGGVLLRWTPPADRGGDDEVDIRILRGTTPDPQETLVEIADFVEFKDTEVEGGVTYYYRLQALNSLGVGPSTTVLEVTVITAPGQVLDLVATAANGRVELGWSAPVDDGGSPVVNYIIMRGIFETGLSEVGRVGGSVLNFTDHTAENGKTYFYKVYAINTIGVGPLSDSVTASPVGPPSVPGVLKAKVKGDAIVLTWTAPTIGGTAQVTGYKVYRGRSDVELTMLVELGDVHSYVDEDVDKGKTYFYKVMATSDSGDGDMSRLADAKIQEEESPALGGAFVLLAMLVGVAATMMRRKG